MNDYKFGICEYCSTPLQPVWFQESEYKKGYKTGRTRIAVSHLVCECCLRNYAVDDSFDGQWK